jgi:transcriptional regulator with XRE-family HTH domain
MTEIKHELVAELSDPDFRHGYAAEFVDMIVAQQIRALRKQRGWTQTELAERIGTKQPFISQIEDEDYGSISISTLKDLARAFDVYLNVRFESFSTLLSQVDASSASELEVPLFAIDPLIKAASVTSDAPIEIPMIDPTQFRKESHGDVATSYFQINMEVISSILAHPTYGATNVIDRLVAAPEAA